MKYAVNHVRRYSETFPKIIQAVPHNESDKQPELAYAKMFGFACLDDKPTDFRDNIMNGSYYPVMLDLQDLHANQRDAFPYGDSKADTRSAP